MNTAQALKLTGCYAVCPMCTHKGGVYYSISFRLESVCAVKAFFTVSRRNLKSIHALPAGNANKNELKRRDLCSPPGSSSSECMETRACSHIEAMHKVCATTGVWAALLVLLLVPEPTTEESKVLTYKELKC